ncbi:MAG: hypothetical protein P9E67_10990 [Candidatus Competibacter sp.]|nr:hypothetical protein [Candidatus Competibacter sp.]
MFRRRPPPWQPKPEAQQPSPPPSPDVPDWAHGFCYLARQNQLIFGSDRHPPVEWRPVVSLVKQGNLFQLLPSTRHPRRKSDFFHIRAEDFFLRRIPAEPPTDSYLNSQRERLSAETLINTGVLPHPLRVQIADWLKYRLGN